MWYVNNTGKNIVVYDNCAPISAMAGAVVYGNNVQGKLDILQPLNIQPSGGHVLFIMEGPYIGGAELMLYNIHKNISNTSYFMSIDSTKSKFNINYDLKLDSTKPEFYNRLVTFIKNHEIGTIVMTNVHVKYRKLLSMIFSGKRIIIYHSKDGFDNGWKIDKNENVDIIVGIHPELTRYIKERLDTQNIKYNDIVTIYNGVEGSKKYRYNKDSKKIINICRLCKDKGIDRFINTAQKFPNNNFIVFGDYEDNRYKTEIQSIKKPNNYFEYGHTNSPINELMQAKIFFMSSVSEGLPLSLLEALSVGLPCVVPNIGGISDVIKTGCNGYAYNNMCEAELYISELLNDKVKCVEISYNARKTFEERFTNDIHIANYEALIKGGEIDSHDSYVCDGSMPESKMIVNTNKENIMLVTQFLDYGGAEKVLLQYASILSSSYNVFIAYGHEDGEIIQNRPLKNRYKKFFENYGSVVLFKQSDKEAIVKFIINNDIKHVVLNQYHVSNEILSEMSNYTKISIVTHSDIAWTNQYIVDNNQYIDNIIAINNLTKHKLGKKIDNNIIYANNTACYCGMKNNSESRIIGFIGRDSTVKNIKMFIDAFYNFNKKVNGYKVMMVGDYTEQTKKYVADKGLSGQIIFTGYADDVRQYIDKMEFMVICSLSEGMPMVVLEALAMGCPVVSSNVGGLSEVINNDTGLLFNFDGYDSVVGDNVYIGGYDNIKKIVNDKFDDGVLALTDKMIEMSKKDKFIIGCNSQLFMRNKYSALNTQRSLKKIFDIGTIKSKMCVPIKLNKKINFEEVSNILRFKNMTIYESNGGLDIKLSGTNDSFVIASEILDKIESMIGHIPTSIDEFIGDVTIAILSYERFEHTKRFVEDFLRLNTINAKLLIIDNGSKNKELIDYLKYISKIKCIDVVLNGKNSGVAGGRNIAIKKCKTKYIMFSDNDMLMYPFMLENMCYAMKVNHADVSYCSMYNHNNKIVTTGSDLLKDKGKMRITNTTNMFEERFVTFVFGGMTIFNKKIFDDLGMLDENMFVGFEDYDMSIRLLDKYKCVYTPYAKILHNHVVLNKNEHNVKYEKERYDLDIIRDAAIYFFNKHGLEVFHKEHENGIINILEAVGL